MDFNEARKILELKTETLSHTELKKAYYRLALQHHPDKQLLNNGSVDRFREVQQAYKILCEYLNTKEIIKEEIINDSDFTFNSLLNQFIKLNTGINFDTSTLKSTIYTTYHTIYVKAFQGLDKDKALKVLEYIEQFSVVLGINDEVISFMKTTIREKIQNDVIIILNPTMDNLINEEIFKLDYDNHIYYIPLWHNEITYDDTFGQSIIVRCVPQLPKHISIDENNNICVNVNLSISSLLERKNITIEVGKKIFYVSVHELKIVKSQKYILYNCGIPNIDLINVFNNKKKSNIVIYITLY